MIIGHSVRFYVAPLSYFTNRFDRKVLSDLRGELQKNFPIKKCFNFHFDIIKYTLIPRMYIFNSLIFCPFGIFKYSLFWHFISYKLK